MITGAATRREPAELANHELQARVNGAEARCAGTAVPPDEWFPLSVDPVKARLHARRALELCRACSVRAECLELSLREWDNAGHHGIWGGTLESERHALRREWLAGATVRSLLRAPAEDRPGGHRRQRARPAACHDWGTG
jgi:hypothetical protein